MSKSIFSKTVKPILSFVSVLSLFFFVVACGDADKIETKNEIDPNAINLTGFWRLEATPPGSDDADVSFFCFEQENETVSGETCSSDGVGTGTFISGTFVFPDLDVSWSWDEGDGTQTTTLTTVVAADGKTMEGSGHSTKCDCDFTVSGTLVLD